MALPANPESPVDVDETLNRIEANAADRIGRRTSWVEWGQETRQIGEGLGYGRLVYALRELFKVKA